MGAICEMLFVEDVGTNFIFMLNCPSPKGFFQGSILLQNPKPQTYTLVSKYHLKRTLPLPYVLKHTETCFIATMCAIMKNNLSSYMEILLHILAPLQPYPRLMGPHQSLTKSQNTIQHTFCLLHYRSSKPSTLISRLFHSPLSNYMLSSFIKSDPLVDMWLFLKALFT